MVNFIKVMFGVLSQDKKEQIAAHMAVKFSCLGSSKDTDSTITDQNELQYIQMIKERKAENAKLKNSIKQ